MSSFRGHFSLLDMSCLLMFQVLSHIPIVQVLMFVNIPSGSVQWEEGLSLKKKVPQVQSSIKLDNNTNKRLSFHVGSSLLRDVRAGCRFHIKQSWISDLPTCLFPQINHSNRVVSGAWMVMCLIWNVSPQLWALGGKKNANLTAVRGTTQIMRGSLGRGSERSQFCGVGFCED